MLRPVITAPVPASTRMNASGGGVPVSRRAPGTRARRRGPRPGPRRRASALVSRRAPRRAGRASPCMAGKARRRPPRSGLEAGSAPANGGPGRIAALREDGAVGRISARIAAINESATLAVDAKAKALKAAGENVIGFGAGEPDFPTPRADHRGRGRRGPRAPLPPLFADAGPARAPRGDRAQDQARLGRRLRGRAGAGHQRRQARGLQHVPGALRPGRRSAAARAVLDLVSRVHHARRRRAGRAADHRGHGFRVTIEQLDAAVTPRTKALLFVSPSNPTGAVYPPDEVEAIGRWALERGIWIVTDEIYEHLTYDGHVFSSMPGLVPELADQCVILNGVAKTYAMTGWRVGWMIGRRDVIAAGDQPAVALDLERRRTSRRPPRSPRSSGDLDAVAQMREAFARRGQDDVRAALGDPGRHVPRAAGRVLLLPVVRGRARPRDRRPHGRRPRSSCARCCSRWPRSRSCPVRRSARPATRGSASPSATTTSARACAGSPTPLAG